ncbi:MAG: Tol-Pal system protein TolB, partial [Quisquiliibacterium sp.]
MTGSLAIVFPVVAQMRIDVSGVGATQYPIAIADFTSTGQIPSNVAEVVRADLSRSGVFRLVDPQMSLSESSLIDFLALRA